MSFKTYEVIRQSPDELVVYAHVWYVGLMIAAVFLVLAIYYAYRAYATHSKSMATLPMLVLAIFFTFLSLNHGQMTFNKATNSFVAERTHWYLGTDRTSTSLDDVDGAHLNQANTTYQVCVELHSSDKCVAIYPLDSAVGQDDAVRSIDRFLLEYQQQKLSKHKASREDQQSDAPEEQTDENESDDDHR